MVALCANISVVGAWEGKENGLPAVELTLRNDNGQISGTIGFYFQTRGNDGKWHSDGKPPFVVPLLSPKLEGTVLTFETIHHRSHGSTELGPKQQVSCRVLTTEKKLACKCFDTALKRMTPHRD